MVVKTLAFSSEVEEPSDLVQLSDDHRIRSKFLDLGSKPGQFRFERFSGKVQRMHDNLFRLKIIVDKLVAFRFQLSEHRFTEYL